MTVDLAVVAWLAVNVLFITAAVLAWKWECRRTDRRDSRRPMAPIVPLDLAAARRRRRRRLG